MVKASVSFRSMAVVAAALLLSVSACGNRPNWPAGQTLVCDCSSSPERIEKIKLIAEELGFIPDWGVHNVSSKVETWLLPFMRHRSRESFVVVIHTRNQSNKLLIAFADSDLEKFSPESKEIIERFRQKLAMAFPGEFNNKP